ncbi:ABC transporter C-terminal domain-containing protein [Mesorhizobium sp. M0016]|uniref:ABC transporter C-terminal domain-containing protein n=1 Tax=Mesorhizobium sp. M0016 TaxID=2956843 RepID=UPI0033377D52
MKQVVKTPDILARLRAAVGNDIAVDNLAVFEAIALNTLPLRKKHPLYNKSVVDRGMLMEMAASLSQESVPLQVMHDSEVLPKGRVFHGQVVDTGANSELRVLFFVDETETDTIKKIDAGTVDQVSVSVLSKKIINSVSGFDYLGADSTFDNVWTGTDPDGNTLGENGCYGKLVGLDVWFETSLVGKGGAQNARIVPRDQAHFGSSYQKLAASGLDPNIFILAASTRNDQMDLTTLVASLNEKSVELALKVSAFSALEASVAGKDTEIAALKLQLADAAKPEVAAELATVKTDLEAKNAELAVAMTALKGIATKVTTAAGKLNITVPETVPEIEALLTETTTNMAALLVAGGKAHDAAEGEKNAAPANLGAFRVRKN